jgi:hypothetical protein
VCSYHIPIQFLSSSLYDAKNVVASQRRVSEICPFVRFSELSCSDPDWDSGHPDCGFSGHSSVPSGIHIDHKALHSMLNNRRRRKSDVI